MAFHVVEQIRKKSRDEWKSESKEKWTGSRIWIQENGEAAFVLGFLLGLVIIAFHKLAIAIIAIGIIACFGVYLIAPEHPEVASETESSGNSSHTSVGEAHTNGIGSETKVHSERV